MTINTSSHHRFSKILRCTRKMLLKPPKMKCYTDDCLFKGGWRLCFFSKYISRCSVMSPLPHSVPSSCGQFRFVTSSTWSLLPLMILRPVWGMTSSTSEICIYIFLSNKNMLHILEITIIQQSWLLISVCLCTTCIPSACGSQRSVSALSDGSYK